MSYGSDIPVTAVEKLYRDRLLDTLPSGQGKSMTLKCYKTPRAIRLQAVLFTGIAFPLPLRAQAGPA